MYLVCSTSDKPAVDRCNAALVATSLAEYYRDEGKEVILFVDSLTRYGRALRDVALSAGKFLSGWGIRHRYLSSYRHCWSAGATKTGVITAFYTVLLDSENEPDGFGDEVRSILDGHIYLSRRLAMQNHYPAIDIPPASAVSCHRLFHRSIWRLPGISGHCWRNRMS